MKNCHWKRTSKCGKWGEAVLCEPGCQNREKWAKNATSGNQTKPYCFVTGETDWHSVP